MFPHIITTFPVRINTGRIIFHFFPPASLQYILFHKRLSFLELEPRHHPIAQNKVRYFRGTFASSLVMVRGSTSYNFHNKFGQLNFLGFLSFLGIYRIFASPLLLLGVNQPSSTFKARYFSFRFLKPTRHVFGLLDFFLTLSYFPNHARFFGQTVRVQKGKPFSD